MWKVLGIALGVLILVVAGAFGYLYCKYLRYDVDYVAEYFQKNPNKFAMYWVRNDTLLVQHRADTLMPLASTVKTIIAIEFAQQVAAGKINPQEGVLLSDLARFYIPNTDGGAHPEWLKEAAKNKLIRDKTVALLEVAKAMIQYSSNANTEFLMWKLGLDNINANLPKLGLIKHQPLYPFVSAIYVCSDENSAKKLREMPLQTYIERANGYFERLQRDTTAKVKFKPENLSMPVQRVWSDRLPAATAQEYVSLMQKINDRTYFDATTQAVLDELMQWPMRLNPKKKAQYAHYGGKGGSTAFVLTYALYCTDKQGNRTELAFFTNDLGNFDQLMVQTEFQGFLDKLLANNEVTKAIKTILTQTK